MVDGRRSCPDPAGADRPVHVALRTTDVDQARAFCRTAYCGLLSLDVVGSLERFAFNGDVVTWGPITVGEISYGSDVHVRVADLQTAYHVLAPLTGTLRSRHRGTVVLADPTRAAVYRPFADIDLDWPGSCRLLSVKIDRTALERKVDVALDRRSESPLPLGASFDLIAGPGRAWAALVRMLHDELRDGGLATQPWMAARWRDMVLSGLALTLEHPYGGESARPRDWLRPRTVKRTLDAIHAEPWRPFTAADLAAVAGVGVRVLQESFRRHLGMSPMTYLRRLRLDGAHADLSRSTAAEVSVSEVAYRWGFTHLGRFAGAYRARYGVSPSQTLRERR